ncbi:uncharacterized protein [Danio rerio]|uniref:Uncharacterized protein n=1 Tax=Danio rerio TaxID=7955 RepID=A0AC58HBG0_DANRE
MSSPSTNPCAEVIQALAVLHQEQHHALVELKKDLERRFQVLMEAQREDREVIRSLLTQEIQPASTSTAHPPIMLQKMALEDDPEVFLDLFEKMAEACGWPRAEWPVRVIPLLSGEAQIAAQQLSAQNLLEYAHLKRAILQRPFAFAQQLRDACRRRLVQDGRTTAQLVDAVVLEQFITRLPSRTSEWVQCHRPDDLETAIRLAEDHLMARSRVGEITSLSLSSCSQAQTAGTAHTCTQTAVRNGGSAKRPKRGGALFGQRGGATTPGGCPDTARILSGSIGCSCWPRGYSGKVQADAFASRARG